jgi:hypothetical protein
VQQFSLQPKNTHGLFRNVIGRLSVVENTVPEDRM